MDNIKKDHILLPPDPERVMEGLRDTGYNFNTAIADIVDNSISANANLIDILIQIDPAMRITVYIADDGYGMDFEGLKDAMKYGSKRRSDPSSLGKFGLGLKTASTAFCRCLSLVSRGEVDSTVRKVQWDLDYIANENSWKLRNPDPTNEEISILDATAKCNSGTLVIWEKIDRLLKNYTCRGNAQNALKKIQDSLIFHLSMVYQRFLDESDTRARNIIISLNGERVNAWDPFCFNEEKTEKLADEHIEVEMPEDKKSEFTVKAYMLPRKEGFSSTAAASLARLSNDMQGFYVYRENRLIHYGDWLGMFTKEPHGTLLRVEFSFDHTLDTAFNVDIKKSRILLSEEIFGYLKDTFMPAPRRAADQRYRTGMGEKVKGKGEDAHAASNRNIEEKAGSVEEAKVKITNKAQNEVQVTNVNGTFNHKISIRSSEKPGQYRVIPVETIEDGMLWRPCIVDVKHAVEINQKHPYYQKIYYPVLEQNVMVTGMDALLWALAEAELSTFNNETRAQYEDMRVHVSRVLKKLIADLPDPEIDEEK